MRSVGLTGLAFLIIIQIGGGVVWVAQTDYAAGRSAGAELGVALGARPAALAGAFTAVCDDLNATAWNPAGLAQAKGLQAGFLHSLYFQDTSQDHAAFTQALWPGAGVGATVAYFNYGSLERMEEQGGMPVPAGDFTPYAYSLSVGYGQWLAPLAAVGGAVKFLSQHIDSETYSAVAADLGVLVRPGVDGLQLGAKVQNLGTPVAGVALPAAVSLGAAYLLPAKAAENDAWRLLLDVGLPFADAASTSLRVATEYGFGDLLAGRVGYIVKDQGGLGGAAGLTAGLGVKVSLFTLDYALASFGDLGLTHQLEVTVSVE